MVTKPYKSVFHEISKEKGHPQGVSQILFSAGTHHECDIWPITQRTWASVTTALKQLPLLTCGLINKVDVKVLWKV